VKVSWTPSARNDLVAIFEHIQRDDPRAASGLVDRLDRAVSRLSEHPGLGRPGRVANTRELVIPRTPYVAAYRVVGDDVQVLRVLHGARMWPSHI
jgi:toxin ParE1/3/4